MRPTRRQFLGFLLTTVASAVFGRRAGAGPSDQGIGGTGLKPPTDESDRGLGGTGVIGTIRKFGSIVVNDLRIAYPQDAAIRIDGRPAAIADLKIGQVVRVAASGKDDALSTRTIDVTHEVVGPVEKIGEKQMTVLGQKVSTEEVKEAGFKAGDVVSVSGLRRNDGTIVASLIEPTAGARSRIAGPLKKNDDGVLTIGGREVVGVDPHLAGQRVVLEGVQSKVHFVAVTTTAEKKLLPSSVRKLSIESYVERSGDTLRSGSGYAFEGGHFDVPSGQSVRAVLQTNVDRDGRLTIDSLRAGGRTYFGGRGPGGRGPGGHGPGGHGPGGRGPGGRGPGGRGPGGHSPSGRGPGGRGPGGHGPGGREFDGRGGFGDREFGGRGSGRRGRGFGRHGARGDGPEGGGGRLPMDFGRERGGPFDGGRGGGGGGGFGGGGGGYDGRGGGGFGGGGPGGFGGGGGGFGGGGGPGGFGGGGPGGFGGGGPGGFGGGGGGGRR